MKSYEITYEGYTFPVMILANGKRIVDLYCDAPLFGAHGERIRNEVKQILNLAV